MVQEDMEILVFKTNIQPVEKTQVVMPLFNSIDGINKWNIDHEDIDNVLRIEAEDFLSESDIIDQVKSCGFLCEVLPD